MTHAASGMGVDIRGMILGIDYGRSHIGLASGDSVLKLALPLKTLSGLSSDEAIEQLKRIVEEHHIRKIIIGEPKSLMFGKGTLEDEVRAFAKVLGDAVHLPVEFVDERFTSDAAEHLRRDAKGGDEHALAAMLILQTYFDMQL